MGPVGAWQCKDCGRVGYTESASPPEFCPWCGSRKLSSKVKVKE